MAADRIQEAVQEYIRHHTMANPHEWTLPFIGHVPLPSFMPLHALMLLIGSAFLLLLFGFGYRKSDGAPRGLTNLLELFVLFVRDQIAIPNLGHEDGRRLTPLFCTLFFFILILNFMGLIPLFATATSNVNVTAGLALLTLMGMIGGGLYRNGPIGFLKTFLPSGVPWPVLIILFPIELIGMFIKPFALTIRLFANMLAGHVVLFSLIGLAVSFGLKAALPAVAMAGAIYLLEVLVAFLQAFIFTLLSAMFVGSFLHPAH